MLDTFMVLWKRICQSRLAQISCMGMMFLLGLGLVIIVVVTSGAGNSGQAVATLPTSDSAPTPVDSSLVIHSTASLTQLAATVTPGVASPTPVLHRTAIPGSVVPTPQPTLAPVVASNPVRPQRHSIGYRAPQITHKPEVTPVVRPQATPTAQSDANDPLAPLRKLLPWIPNVPLPKDASPTVPGNGNQLTNSLAGGSTLMQTNAQFWLVLIGLSLIVFSGLGLYVTRRRHR